MKNTTNYYTKKNKKPSDFRIKRQSTDILVGVDKFGDTTRQSVEHRRKRRTKYIEKILNDPFIMSV